MLLSRSEPWMPGFPSGPSSGIPCTTRTGQSTDAYLLTSFPFSIFVYTEATVSASAVR